MHGLAHRLTDGEESHQTETAGALDIAWGLWT